jgi:tetratricopeptide (TPR) repeat protein
MKAGIIFLFFFIAIGCLTGCAHLTEEPSEQRSGEAFLASTLQKAATYESRGEWVEALREYKIALALSPQDREAHEGRRRAEERLGTLAEEQYIQGRRLYGEGKFSEARRRFLTALRLQQDHAGALETLTSRKRLPAQDYVVHKLQAGESLSKLAMNYYGDPSQFPIIAKFNQIPDAHLVSVGQELKIPVLAGPVKEIPGRKSPAVKEAEKEIPPGYWDWSSIEAEQAERSMPVEKAKAEEVDQIASYRELGGELFREGRYEEALFEFKKVLSVYPDDQLAADYAYTASFALGLSMFQSKDYLAARDSFASALAYRIDCRQSHAFLKESEALYKEMHYKRGIEYYGKEQLGEAIRAWEMVQRLDPTYKRVDYYIGKAKEIQGKLEELRRETQESLSD